MIRMEDGTGLDGMEWDGHHQIKSIESSDQIRSEKIWPGDCTCSPSEAKCANRPHDDEPQIFAHHSHFEVTQAGSQRVLGWLPLN